MGSDGCARKRGRYIEVVYLCLSICVLYVCECVCVRVCWPLQDIYLLIPAAVGWDPMGALESVDGI